MQQSSLNNQQVDHRRAAAADLRKKHLSFQANHENRYNNNQQQEKKETKEDSSWWNNLFGGDSKQSNKDDSTINQKTNTWNQQQKTTKSWEQRNQQSSSSFEQAQKKIHDAIVMGHQKWTQLINKYRVRVPKALSEKFESMAKDQEGMTQEFNERVRRVSHLDLASKKAAMQKIGKWYEDKDAELFQKHHWSSCWLMSQLVHKEFKNNAIMNEQFKQHCPNMFKKQKEQLSSSSWGKYNSK